MIKSVFQSCIDSGKYRHIFQGEILTETCSEVRCLGVVNFCLFVTHAGAGQWLRAGPALSKSPWGLIIVTFGCDDSHPRICFMWLHSEQPICVPASGFCIFVILCHLSSQRFENLKIWKICCYCTMFVFERSDLCLQYIVCLCALPLIVASISFCETNDVLYSQLSLLDSESIVACVHPSLTYLMAGFCRRPAAQIEKFSVTKWNAWLCLRSRKIGDCSILIPDSISDVLHAATKVDFRPTVVDISAARTHDEWVNIDEHKRCTQAIFPPLSVIVGVEVGRRGEMKRPLAPLGARNPSPYSEKFRKRYQSHFEALGLHLFVRDAERCSDDCANSSNPTYSRSSHKHAHRTLQSICHFPQPLSLRHQGLWQWRVHGGTLRSWLRKQLQLCQHTLVVWAEATQVVVFCCWRKMRENKKDLTYCRWI